MEIQLKFPDFPTFMHYIRFNPEWFEACSKFLGAELPVGTIWDKYPEPAVFAIFAICLRWIQPRFPEDFFRIAGLNVLIPQWMPKA